MRSGLRVLTLFLAVGAAAWAAPAPGRSPRAELEGLQAAVEAAVSRVSGPASFMTARTARAYHVPGYGAFVTLAPRALPRQRRAPGPRERLHLRELERGLEQHLATVTDPGERRALERALGAMRDDMAPFPRLAIRKLRPGQDPTGIRVLEEQAESFLRAAEEAMAEAEHDVLVQLRPPDPPVPPAVAAVPAAPRPPVVANPPDAPLAHPPLVAPVPPGVGVRPTLPAPPVPDAFFSDRGPFRFSERESDVSPEELLREVRDAIVAGLAAHRGTLDHLGDEDMVVVAVDFLPRIPDRLPVRTVVARAKKKDVAAARGGRLGVADLRSRVAFHEY